MNYAAVKKHDVANGTGIRVSLFVSGCTHHCKGCFNPETWDFGFGSVYTDETEKEILSALDSEYIKGLSLLGGEPMEPENLPVLLELVKKVREKYPDKTIWCYTGYDFEKDILGYMKDTRPEVMQFLRQIDVLVDGEFKEDLKDLRLKFRGSSNQHIIDVIRSLEENKTVYMELS